MLRFSCLLLSLLVSVTGPTDWALASNAPYLLRASQSLDDPLRMAIAAVNEVLGDKIPSLKSISATGSPEVGDDIIPVYHVAPTYNFSIAAVPSNCRCIVINGLGFEKSFATLSGGSILLQGKEVQMLVFLLLHEIGHIQAGHYGQFLPNLETAQVNSENNLSKDQETEADSYAAAALRRALRDLGESDEIELNKSFFDFVFTTTFLSFLSFELANRVNAECLTCWMYSDPRIFWDHGRSHPNFLFRVLRINYEISKSEVSLRLLQGFEDKRTESDPDGPIILFQTPGLDLRLKGSAIPP